MTDSTSDVPTDVAPNDPPAPNPLADVAQAIVGAAITSAPAAEALRKTVCSTVAVVQPAVSGWLRTAARLFRCR